MIATPPLPLLAAEIRRISIERRFFCETRHGVVADLLFRILKGCEHDPELGKVVEDLTWSSWSVHENEQVRCLLLRLML